MEIDHIEPVIPVEGLREINGHPDWNQLYERVFTEWLRALCKECHAANTKAQNKLRDEGE